jgi:hypothetical protein
LGDLIHEILLQKEITMTKIGHKRRETHGWVRGKKWRRECGEEFPSFIASR